jgi:hypothetical protein
MQISGNNLLVASQQVRAPQPAKPPVATQQASEQPRQTAAAMAQRLGSNLDIRV